VDPGLTDERSVEAEVEVVAGRDRVVHAAAPCTGHRVHPDQERGIAALLEEARVLRPVLLHDVLAVGVEEVGDE